MTHKDFIELDRHFYPYSSNSPVAEDYETRIAFGLSKSIKWSDLLGEYRVVILAEAGAGKTEEIREAAFKLQNQGTPAFFFRLEYLSHGIENSFEVGDSNSFNQWKGSDEEAWIFLDSVDEARLSNPKDFEKAIRIFSSDLGDCAQRAHVYVTSRVTEWRPVSDLALVKSQLPHKKQIKKIEAENEGTVSNALKPGLIEDEATETTEEKSLSNCSIPDDRIDPRRSALFMARSVLQELRDGGAGC